MGGLYALRRWGASPIDDRSRSILPPSLGKSYLHGNGNRRKPDVKGVDRLNQARLTRRSTETRLNLTPWAADVCLWHLADVGRNLCAALFYAPSLAMREIELSTNNHKKRTLQKCVGDPPASMAIL
jgi:hypothetical protein